MLKGVLQSEGEQKGRWGCQSKTSLSSTFSPRHGKEILGNSGFGALGSSDLHQRVGWPVNLGFRAPQSGYLHRIINSQFQRVLSSPTAGTHFPFPPLHALISPVPPSPVDSMSRRITSPHFYHQQLTPGSSSVPQATYPALERKETYLTSAFKDEAKCIS